MSKAESLLNQALETNEGRDQLTRLLRDLQEFRNKVFSDHKDVRVEVFTDEFIHAMAAVARSECVPHVQQEDLILLLGQTMKYSINIHNHLQILETKV